METWQEAACYIRVSTEDQTEYSPEAQRRALEHYARQHQLTISPEHVYIDAGISGRRAETRPAFMAMIAAAKKRPPPFSVILVISSTVLPGTGRTVSSINLCCGGSAECKLSVSQNTWKTTK